MTDMGSETGSPLRAGEQTAGCYLNLVPRQHLYVVIRPSFTCGLERGRVWFV